MPFGPPGEADQGNHPEEHVGDRDPIEVVPARAPRKKRAPPVRSLPVHEEMTEHRHTDTQREPSPRRGRRRFATAALHPPVHEPPSAADQQREGHDLDEGAGERVGDTAMELQELGTRARQPDEQLAPIRRVRRDDADRRGARYVTVGDRASERGAD